MKVVIVNAFDTYEHRVDLLYDYFKRKNCNVHVYASVYNESRKIFAKDVPG